MSSLGSLDLYKFAAEGGAPRGDVGRMGHGTMRGWGWEMGKWKASALPAGSALGALVLGQGFLVETQCHSPQGSGGTSPPGYHPNAPLLSALLMERHI